MSVDGLQRSCRWRSAESVKGRAEPSRGLGGMRWLKLWKEKVINMSRTPAILKQDPPHPSLHQPPAQVWKSLSLFQGGEKGQGFLGSHAAGCHLVP